MAFPLFPDFSKVLVSNAQTLMDKESQLGMQADLSYVTPNHVVQPFIRICNRASFFQVGTKHLCEMVCVDGKEKVPFTAEVVVETWFCQFCSRTDVVGRCATITLLKKKLQNRAQDCVPFFCGTFLFFFGCHFLFSLPSYILCPEESKPGTLRFSLYHRLGI